MTRSQFKKQLQDGLNTVFGLEYKDRPEVWRGYMRVETESRKAYLEDVLMAGLGAAAIKAEGAAVTYDNTSESYTARYVFETIALAFSITEEAEEAKVVRKFSAAAGSETILVVEDEPDVRMVVCKMLSMRGYNVLEAPGPKEALAIFEDNSERIDLLLTDVIMPVMNGRELHERIASMKPGIKTLYMSGYADGVIDDTGIVPGGVNFLQKPFSPEALAAKVAGIFEQQI